ncbi:MAG: elongation factor 1-beta [Candidatus Jordarchaeum sp.]|uniref:elongation factor 1-beta n=1 Tax=Candidatus Jordarchaeum sp. TaxID=2823881 RepID=UPI00404B7703
MAKVVATIKIFPESTEVNLDELKTKIEKNLPEGTEIHSSQEVPIAFGLKALRLNIIVPEAEGGTDHIEQAIQEIEEVSEIEVEMVRRI